MAKYAANWMRTREAFLSSETCLKMAGSGATSSSGLLHALVMLLCGCITLAFSALDSETIANCHPALRWWNAHNDWLALLMAQREGPVSALVGQDIDFFLHAAVLAQSRFILTLQLLCRGNNPVIFSSMNLLHFVEPEPWNSELTPSTSGPTSVGMPV